MPKVAKELGALAVSRLREPGMHAVGGVAGLHLQVTGTGARTWILRIRVGDARREMGLGAFPGVPLAEAREAARRARDLVRQGVDPIEQQKAARDALRAATARSINFRDAAERFVEAHRAGWKNAKHADQWTNTLVAYAYPTIGALSVDAIELPHVLAVLEPIWTTKPETASRLRGRIEQVLDWSTARGHRQGLNPARWRGHLDHLLPARSKVARVQHHAALPIDDVPEFMGRLRAMPGMGARALEFAILTAARSGEVRGATWGETDLQTGTWSVPAERMKAARPHRVPLSADAAALLRALPGADTAQPDDLLFPGRQGQLSDMSLTACVRRLKVDAVPHGIARSSFRDWAAERTSFPNEMAELALAHVVGDKVEAAYRRGDQFEKRRDMMNAWAEFIRSTDRSKS